MRDEEINLKGIFAFLFLLAVTLAATYGAMWLMAAHFEEKALKLDQQAALMAPASSLLSSRPYFPYPREQPAPRADLEALRAQEERDLHSYAWIDRTNGIVRIPMDRAMDLMVQTREGKP